MKAPTEWSPHFSAFAPDTIAWLASLGVKLVGIDAQSVDPADSKTLDSHQQLLAHDLRVLENLVLDDVDAGDYELIALPLKLTHGVRLAGPRRAALAAINDPRISRIARIARTRGRPFARRDGETERRDQESSIGSISLS